MRLAVLVGMLVAASIGAWTAEGKVKLYTACVQANAGESGVEQFCACLVREMEKRVTEEEVEAYARPEPSPSDAKVYTLGREAVRECLGEMKAGETSI